MITMVLNGSKKKNVWFWLIMSNIQHPFWLLVTCFDLDRSEVGSSAISEDLWEANACALIECSFYNVSQSFTMAQISWWPFSSHRGEKNKHKEWKKKNACQATMSNGLTINRAKRMCKTCNPLSWKTYGIWWYERRRVKLKWKALMILNNTIHVQVERRKRQ
jgi:hypothetical protein